LPADATQLHHASIVIDSMVDIGEPGPRVYTPSMLARLDELADAGTPPEHAIDAIAVMADEALLRGELAGYWEGWDASGVDAVMVTVGELGEDGPFTYENAIRDLARWSEKFEATDRFVNVAHAADAERAHAEHKTGIILNFQNTEHLGADLDALEEFYDLGIRSIQLTYNSHNLVGDGCMVRDPSGLSGFGVQVVNTMNELGILVDVSHCSHPTAFDALEASDKPIAITHGFAKALNGHDRGSSDDLIRAVGERGYIGVVLVPFFLTKDPVATLDHFLRHVDHIVGLAGADHVGIATDWTPPMPPRLQAMLTATMQSLGFRPEHRVDWGSSVEGFSRWEEWPNITGALLAHGYSDDEVRGIIGGNFVRIFREVAG
jgi:membrane dipeptidase